jgi:ribonuclease HIII
MMKILSAAAGETLLRGANDQVLEQGKILVRKFGINRFGDFAKLHFSTAQRAMFA